MSDTSIEMATIKTYASPDLKLRQKLNSWFPYVDPKKTTSAPEKVSTPEKVSVTVSTPEKVSVKVSTPSLNEILETNRAAFESTKRRTANIFMISIFVIGFITFIVSWNVDKDLQNNTDTAKVCASSNIRQFNKIVLCLSTAMITASAFYYFGRCDSPESVHYKYYIYISLFLGLCLLISGAVIAQQSTTANCHTNAHPEIIWILGLLVTMLSAGLIFYINKKN
jgi:hypothetical protein